MKLGSMQNISVIQMHQISVDPASWLVRQPLAEAQPINAATVIN